MLNQIVNHVTLRLMDHLSNRSGQIGPLFGPILVNLLIVGHFKRSRAPI